jgi:hypothetical protein
VKKARLSTSMTIGDLDRGYWYAAELKKFAKKIGVGSREFPPAATSTS